MCARERNNKFIFCTELQGQHLTEKEKEKKNMLQTTTGGSYLPKILLKIKLCLDTKLI